MVNCGPRVVPFSCSGVCPVRQLPRRVVRPFVRLVLVAAAVAAAACGDSTTAPLGALPLTPTAPRYDISDTATCRSGYNVTQGRCN